MANASKHHIGPGSQGKNSSTGAMTELPEETLQDNMVLSNRDKSHHAGDLPDTQPTLSEEQCGSPHALIPLPSDH